MSLRNFLQNEITYKNPTGTNDRHGKDALGAAVVTNSRFERIYKTVFDANKEAKPIHGKFIVSPDDVIEIGAQVSYADTLYRVLERNDAPGRNGSVHHYELLCQLWSYES